MKNTKLSLPKPHSKTFGRSLPGLIAVTVAASALQAQVPEPLVHYLFDEDSGNVVTDVSGNGFHGEMINFVSDEGSQWIEGKDGGALRFSGGGVVIENLPELTSTTWGAWVRLDEPLRHASIMSATFPGANIGHSLGFHGGITASLSPRVIWNHGVSSTVFNVGNVVSGEWNHLAVTFDEASGELIYYRNGEEVQVRTGTMEPFTEMRLGQRASTEGGNPFNGALDQVVVYDRALSPEEVAQLAQHNVASAGLVALYEMDDGDGLVAADSSGNGHHGTLVEFHRHRVDGVIGGGLDFEGAGYVRVSDLPEITSTTWATWVRLAPKLAEPAFATDTAHNHFGAMISATFPGAVAGHVLRFGDESQKTTPRPLWNHGVDSTSLTSPDALIPGEWYHLALTVDADAEELRFYIDGVLKLVEPATTSPFTTLNIGREEARAHFYFDGSLDDVRIYDVALSEQDVAVLALRDVEGPPVIIVHPESVAVIEGETASFHVEADGAAPFSYRWYRDGTFVGETETGTLSFPSVAAEDEGEYTVEVINDFGTDVSDPAILTVKVFRDEPIGLVVEYDFNHTSGLTVADRSGNGFDGELIGFADGSSHWIPGVSGNALRIQSPGYVNIPDLPLFTSTTWATWVRADSQQNHQSVISAAFSGSAAGHVLGVRNGSLAPLQPRVLWNHNVTATALVGPAIVTVGEWNHLAMTLDADTNELKLYWNGSVIDSASSVATSPFFRMNIGRRVSDQGFFMDGAVDNLRIYDIVLTEEEVLALAAAPPPPPVDIRIVSVELNQEGGLDLLIDTPSPEGEHRIEHKLALEDSDWGDVTGVDFSPQGGFLLASFALPDPDAGRSFFRVVFEGEVALFFEDFESGAAGWTTGGTGNNWELGTPQNGPGEAFSGDNVYATSLTGNTNPGMKAWLRSPPIDLTGVDAATLEFYEWLRIDPNPAFHKTIVRTLDASTLTVLEELDVKAGAVLNWSSRTLPLGEASLGKEIVIEFFMDTDTFEMREGWYIDDVRIY